MRVPRFVGLSLAMTLMALLYAGAPVASAQFGTCTVPDVDCSIDEGIWFGSIFVDAVERGFALDDGDPETLNPFESNPPATTVSFSSGTVNVQGDGRDSRIRISVGTPMWSGVEVWVTDMFSVTETASNCFNYNPRAVYCVGSTYNAITDIRAYGGAGNDSIEDTDNAFTFPDHVKLYGQDGDDHLRGLHAEGGAGDDRLFEAYSGTPIRDSGRLEGGPGNDSLDAYPHDLSPPLNDPDDLLGGPGNDRIDASDSSVDNIDCGDGNDVLVRDTNEEAVDCETATPHTGALLTPPSPVITSKPSDPTTSASAHFEWTSASPGGSFECQLDSGAYGSCSSPRDYSSLSTGEHTFRVRQIGGTVSTGTGPAATYTWTVNAAAAPNAPTITQKPSNPSNSTSASFGFSGESGASFECKIDAGAFASCTSPKSYSGLAQGSHTFEVRQTTAGGTSSPASYTWTIDSVAPNPPTITSNPSNPSTSRDASFQWTGAEPGGSFSCQLDSRPEESCASPKSYSLLTDGSHTFQVRQTDAAGNAGAPASYTWTVNANPNPSAGPPPPPVITDKPSNPTSSTSATFGFAGMPGASFECKLDAGAYASCTSPKSYSSLAQGSHTFQVRQTTSGGTSEPAAHTWSITAPGTVNSSSCDSSTQKVADGYAGSTYVKLRTAQPDSQTTLVCLRVVNGGTSFGEAIRITTPGSAPQPSHDADFGSCGANTATNVVPGPHPIPTPQVLDPTDPVHLRTLLDVYSNTQQLWVCLRVDVGAADLQKRIVVPLAAPGTPQVERFQDSLPADPEQAPPPGYASRSCQDGIGGTKTRVANADVANAHGWLYTWQEPAPSGKTHVCVRGSGPASAGGRLTIDSGSAPPVPVTQSDNFSDCSAMPVLFDFGSLHIRRSFAIPPSSLPVTVCVYKDADVTGGASGKKLTINQPSTGSTPKLSWTPDPDTPGGPVGPLP